ncbi:MAG: hypothetical protein ACE37B_13505 [Ilumatobacter sp.]|uniref:hypothetical protein n=1 Tax=Ilumatobacter sp. TaxID=1967498 RepID=UPI00391DA557
MSNGETNEETTPESPSASRRAILSKGAIAAAVGAAAGIAMSDRTSAIDGDVMNVGATEFGTSRTTLTGGSTFAVLGGGLSDASNASIYGQTASTFGDYGVRGTYQGSSTQRGAGVYGDSNGEQSPGVYGIHTSSTTSSPGVRGESQNGAGVYGVNTDTLSGGIGVHGVTGGTSGGNGVRGEAQGTDSIGVYGISTGTRSSGVEGKTSSQGSSGVVGRHEKNLDGDTGSGVTGISDNGAGVQGSGTSSDFVAAGSGIIRISATVTPAIAATTTGSAGSIARSTDGTLWYCYEPDKWQRIGGAATAGGFTAVTPFRVYDSRQETDGRFAGGTNRTISVADSKDVDTYATVTANAVPAGATAVTANVVAIGTTTTGFLSINPGGITAISAATVNWGPGLNIGNAGTFALNAARELEAVFGPGGGAHMTIDITGYYL